MRIRILFTIILLGLAAGPVAAQTGRTFPYEAIVESDAAEVRSGNDSKYYATQRLRQGNRVVVHRHDWGGWHMIEPPAGSFSWINADYIERTAPDQGVVTENGVAVWVGSALDETARDVYQRTLSKGETVAIIGEKTFATGKGPARMFQIRPPRGEWRWIAAAAVVPLDAAKLEPQPRDPFLQQPAEPVADEPSQSEFVPSPEVAEQPALVERPVVRTQPGNAVRVSGPTGAELERDRSRLKQIDQQFRAMLERDPNQWNLDGLAGAYRQLQQSVSSTALTSQIDMRLAAVERYRKIKQEYDAFNRLTSEARRRDAQLLSLQREQAQRLEQFDSQAVSNTQTPQSPVNLEPIPVPQPAQRQPTQPPQYRPQPAPQQLPQQPIPQNYRPQPVPQQYRPQPIPQQYQPQPAPQQYQPASPQLQSQPAPQQYRPSPQPQGFGQQSGLSQPRLGPSQPVVPNSTGGPDSPPASAPVQLAPPSRQTAPVQQPPQMQPASAGQSLSPGASPHQPVQPTQGQAAAAPKFDGAGIIQRAAASTAGAPRHVLLAPNGRVLAYLQAENPQQLNFDRHIGQAMGIHGQRSFHQQLQTDLIVVRQLTPVRLME